MRAAVGELDGVVVTTRPILDGGARFNEGITQLAVAVIDLDVADRAEHTHPRYVDASSRRTSVTGATFR